MSVDFRHSSATAKPIQFHLTVHHITKQKLTIVGADGEEIHPFPRVIVAF
jgi:hypothetical protein